ncbi:hypothetical protein H9Y05_06700 [Crocinitomicaceae bacterium CZZ-1]|uniref:DUF6089 domain-containing protein n=1 Tax=Taishania pollutisoli TaxID=2766479 RepID=A0A8J6P8N3_9FLAO|nr:DUF6089 family protein [Taishania pollutisoli]MBC9812166.1 hypothetical protein [Taishania pollutisoli]MBX2950594.1 hypothetical protein [Crocinitomicaceae bacterium]NGF74673.1 hypothetical protein [Fluviicola sp. SGL-29]
MKLKNTFLLLVFIGASLGLNAQFHTALSRSEIGVMLGGSYYIGDLNRFGHFKGTQPAGSLFYRYNIHSRLSFRVNFSYGNVVGDDKWSKDPLLSNRNLNFKSDIFELGAGVEFHYMPFQLGSKKYRGTAYFLAELAVFRMNPKTQHNGEWIFLQPLGTEGQGTALGTRGHYNLFQVAIPLGLGVKLSLGKRASIGLEYGIRKTFTDYLDDVGADAYVDPVELAATSGPLAATLSNRSLDGSRYGKRGTAATKDWYAFFGVTLTFRLGNPNNCAFMQ